MQQPAGKIMQRVYVVLMIAFFIGLFCSLRAVSSIGTMALVVASLVGNRLAYGRWWNPNYLNLFSAGCALFLLLQVVALLYTDQKSEGLKAIQLKSALVAIPVIAPYLLQLGRDGWRRLMVWYTGLLTAATLCCLVYAVVRYASTGNYAVFFYHALVGVFEHHAVQYSIVVFAAIVFLKESTNEGFYLVNRLFHWALLSWFVIFLVMLSSKLIISITACYFIYESVLRRRFMRPRWIRLVSLLLIGLAAVALIFVKNPVSERFMSEVYGKVDVLHQRTFTPADYFTGSEFRLLQWRFAYEILSENHRWWLGMSPGDAQEYLNRKYVSVHMYTGGNENNKNGFLGYNSHNQFLQSVLGNGIVGLLAFLLACAGLVAMAVRKKDVQLSFMVIMLIAFSFSESVFETQYALVIFTLLPLLFYYRPGAAEAVPA